MRCRSTVCRCTGVALRAAADGGPLRDPALDDAGQVQSLPHRDEPGPGGQQVGEQVRGRPAARASGSGGAAAARLVHRGRRRAAGCARAATTSAARSASSGSVDGSAERPRTDLAVVLEQAVAQRVSAAAGADRRAGCGPAGTGRRGVRSRPGRRRWSRPEVDHLGEQGRRRRAGRAGPRRVVVLRAEPVAAPAGDHVHGVADVEQRARRRASTSPCGRSASHAAVSARSTVMSRSPPRASLRSGSRVWARSPWRACRSSMDSMQLRQPLAGVGRASRAPRVARAAVTTSGSPATQVRSSRPTAAARSPDATLRHWVTVRTLWSSRTPASQTGYQSRSASSVTSVVVRERP